MRVLQVPPSLPTYTIEGLTVEEVTTLHRLLYNHITGPDDGPRGVLSRISTALKEVVLEPDSQPLRVRGTPILHLLG